MPQINYTFFGPVMPSKKNGKKKVRRGKRDFMVPSDAYQAWEKHHKAALLAKFKSPKLDSFCIEVWPYYVSDIVRDTDNTVTSILDCLKAGGVIKDDRHQYQTAQPFTHQPVIDPENPRVEIVIKWDSDTTKPSAKSAIVQ